VIRRVIVEGEGQYGRYYRLQIPKQLIESLGGDIRGPDGKIHVGVELVWNRGRPRLVVDFLKD